MYRIQTLNVNEQVGVITWYCVIAPDGEEVCRCAKATNAGRIASLLNNGQ